MRKTKKNKISRYLKVTKKKASRLNWKKVLAWFNNNLKGHPFILSAVLFLWFVQIVGVFYRHLGLKELVMYHLRLHLVLFIAWLVLVVFSNALKDKKRSVKWYFKKRLVFILLMLFFPLGAILLWVGADFKRVTKIILTLIFSLFFVSGYIRNDAEYRKIENMPAFERITSMMAKQKSKTFLKKIVLGNLNNIVLLEESKAKPRAKMAVSEIYSRYSKSIVAITTKDKTGKEIGKGSGFVISKDGFIATNSHVIKGAYKAEVKIDEGSAYEAFLIRNKPVFDIAILKIDSQELQPLVLGDSDKIESGQVVIALGNPFGFERSISSGVVSAVRTSPIIKLIQITAPVSAGSSGGPIFNEYGEVVGIAALASFYLAQNLNFAIPINYLKNTVTNEN